MNAALARHPLKPMSETTPLPYRTAPVTCEDEGTLRRLNKAEGRKGAFRFVAASQSLDAIRYGGGSPTRVRVLSWIQHPDERVPLAVLEAHRSINLNRDITADGSVPAKRPDGSEVIQERHESLSRHLVERTDSAADAEGLLWTPLLDAVQLAAEDVDKERYRARTVAERKLLNHFGGERMRLEKIHALGAWAAGQTDPESIRPLITQFRSVALLRAMARNAACLDGPMVRALMDAGCRRELASNPNLPEPIARGMAKDSIGAFWRRAPGTALAEPRGPADAHTFSRARDLYSKWGETLVLLDGAGHGLPEEMKEQLMDYATSAQVGPALRLSAQRTLAGMASGVSPEELMLLAEAGALEHPWVCEALVRRGDAPAAVLGRMAEIQQGVPQVLRNLAQHARFVPGVRKVLIEHGDDEVLRRLIRDAGPEDWGRIFCRMATFGDRPEIRRHLQSYAREAGPGLLASVRAPDWADLLGMFQSRPDVADSLLTLPQARKDAEVCAAALTADLRADSFSLLCEDAPHPYHLQAFRRLAEIFPRMAAHHLRDSRRLRADALQEDVAVLLASTDSEARMEAMIAWGEIVRERRANEGHGEAGTRSPAGPVRTPRRLGMIGRLRVR